MTIDIPDTTKSEGLTSVIVPENAEPSLIVTATVAINVPMGELLGMLGLGVGSSLTSIGTGRAVGPVDGFVWFPAQYRQVASVVRKKSCPCA